MLKSVPYVKTKCGNKNASATFAERNSLGIIWFNVLLLTLKKLLTKTVLVRKSLFHLFWHWFIAPSYKR